jgi:hypothetical protein
VRRHLTSSFGFEYRYMGVRFRVTWALEAHGFELESSCAHGLHLAMEFWSLGQMLTQGFVGLAGI